MKSITSFFRHAASMTISSDELNKLQNDLGHSGPLKEYAIEKINSAKFVRRIEKTNNTKKENTIRALSRKVNTHNVPMSKCHVATDSKTILRTEGLSDCIGIQGGRIRCTIVQLISEMKMKCLILVHFRYQKKRIMRLTVLKKR